MISLMEPNVGLTFEQVKELSVPQCFRDLNLNLYTETFAANEYAEELVPYFYYFPKSLAETEYRQEVSKDLSDPEIRACVGRFVTGIGIAERYLEYSEKVTSSVQKSKWRLDTITQFYNAIERFCFDLNTYPPKSKAFYGLHQELSNLLSNPEVVAIRKKASEINAEFDKFRFHMVINKERATLDFLYKEDDYCSEIRSEFAKNENDKDEHTFTESPFGDMMIAPLEEFILNQFMKRDRVLFRDLETFCGIRREIITTDILDLIRELRFYTINLEYFEKMQQKNFPFSFPKISTDSEIYLDDCYDLVLAAKNYAEKKEVVFNDIVKSSSEKAIVITGPNQGGKTTLARAFGQCCYLGMMGFPISAGVAKLPYFDHIFTQFASTAGVGVEGRLEHELNGVSEILSNMTKRSLILFNELFTSAPTVDALTMMRDLLDKILRCGAVCLVVTHTFELAGDSPDYVSLVATVVEDGSYRRTYRIIRKSADGIAYANSIVGKYKLDFQHINYRLNKGNKA